MLGDVEAVGEEWAEWYLMTPQQRWAESERLLDAYLAYRFAFPDRRITLLASSEKAELGDRILAKIGQPSAERAQLDHRYYDGLRFQIAARSIDGVHIPLIDGGQFDWVGTFAANRRYAFVASGSYELDVWAGEDLIVCAPVQLDDRTVWPGRP